LAGKRSSLGATGLWGDDTPHSKLVFIGSNEQPNFDELKNFLDVCLHGRTTENQLVNWRNIPKKGDSCQPTMTS